MSFIQNILLLIIGALILAALGLGVVVLRGQQAVAGLAQELEQQKNAIQQNQLEQKDTAAGWVQVGKQWHQVTKQSTTIGEVSDYYIDGVRCNVTGRLFTY